MKRLQIYFLLMALLAIVSCDTEPSLVPYFKAELETDQIEFTHKGGTEEFALESNEEWIVENLPGWLQVDVKEDETLRSEGYSRGRKIVSITAKANEENEPRSVELTFLTVSKSKSFKLTVVQKKKPVLMGYWMLSEGSPSAEEAELAFYDAEKKELKVKQFETINSKKLGTLGNALGIYGSKMYCVITGPGFGADTSAGGGHIEVLNPLNGKSIKRIPVLTKDGKLAKPRELLFDQGKVFVSTYHQEVIRIDTVSLEIDKHAAITGTLSEGMTMNNGKLYVTNSGQGNDNKISVVNPVEMKEEKVVEVNPNPTGIVSIAPGEMYYITGYDKYAFVKMSVKDGKESFEPVKGIQMSDFTSHPNGKIYGVYFDWTTYAGNVIEYDPSSGKAKNLKLDFEAAGIPFMMHYHVGVIDGTDELFVTTMGDEMIIVDVNEPKIKHMFNSKSAYGSTIVAVMK